MEALIITYVFLTHLSPAPRNVRRHARKQIRKLARAIEEFGFKVPILATRDGQIVAGHGRWEAAKLLGLEKVPVIYVDDLSPEQIRLFAIADNRLHDLSDFSEEALKLELSELLELGVDLDLTLTGFDTGTLDIILDDDDRDPADAEPSIPARAARAISRLGDIFQIGPHRIICGDALNPWTYSLLLAGVLAQMVITDSPYNVVIDGNVCGAGSVHHREFAMASGEMSKSEFTDFLAKVMEQLIKFSVDGSIHYLFMDFRHTGEMLAAAEGRYTEFLNLCVWMKSNAGMGSLYRSQHELVFVYKSGKAPHINNVELGKHGRNRTNIWRYRGMNSFGKGRDEALAQHPTVKPVDLVADAIRDCSERDGIILDAFLGSGTTLLAAEKTGRRGYGIEIDPHYVDIAVQRIAQATGVPAILVSTGQTFAEIAAERASDQGGTR
jgi:DNA modification methylase